MARRRALSSAHGLEAACLQRVGADPAKLFLRKSGDVVQLFVKKWKGNW
jgi:hypothetical protein